MMVLRFREGVHEYAGLPIVEKKYEDIQDTIWLSIKPIDLWDEYVKSCVTFRIAEDYFAVCQIPLFENPEAVTSQVIEIFQIDEWGITAEELFEKALENQRKHLAYLYNLDDYLYYREELMAPKPTNLLDKSKWGNPTGAMLLWCGEYISFSANLMCDNRLLCRIRDELNSGFYIFPASRHRILIQKAGRAPCFEELIKMGKEIERSEIQIIFLAKISSISIRSKRP
ncbi:MAG: hypothetical protein IJM83_05445 [Firmicutes bacterium]|nr:hypothetical protein [Bacillota bacterium]